MSSFQPGDVLGRYRLERLLGAGAMGEVYLARDPHIDRPVAVKTLLLTGVEESEIADRKERMMREARAAGCILHPHVVTLFDAGHHEGHFFLAFEFVAGGDLSKRLKAGPLPLGEALRFTREACLGLGHAHGLGIVHRDIKPSNLMLDGHGRIKISDFGIAKMAGQGTELTITGTVIGSPHYLSPEQVRDLPLDGRSDIFSLGIVFYEMLCGVRPFEGETISTLIYKILDTEAPPMAGLKSDLEGRLTELIRRMLAKDREERFPDAAAVAGELARLERELSPEMLQATALTAAAPTDATLPIDTDEEGLPSGVVGGAVAGTALRQPEAPETRSSGTGAATTAEPGEVAAAATVPPPPPVEAPPAPFIPPPPPPAAPSGGGAAPKPLEPTAASMGGEVPSGGTYEVPSFQGRPRSRRRVLLAALLAVVLVAALFTVLSRNQEEPVEPVASTAAEPAEADLGGATWPPPPRRPGADARGEADPLEASDTAGSASRPAGAGERETTPPVTQRAQDPPVSRDRSTPGADPGNDARPDRASSTTSRSERPAPGTAVAPGSALDPAPPAAERPGGGSTRTDDGPSPDARLASSMSLRFEIVPPDAFVLVNGTVIGRAADYGRRGNGSYDLPSTGRHRITLRRDGMEDYHVLVDASTSRSGTTPVRARMQPLAAAEVPFHELERHRVREAIALRVDPPTARVLVDDEPAGVARQYGGGRLRRGGWLELPLGMHRVSLIAPGRKRVDLAVDVTSGAEQVRKRIDITLPPLGDSP